MRISTRAVVIHRICDETLTLNNLTRMLFFIVKSNFKHVTELLKTQIVTEYRPLNLEFRFRQKISFSLQVLIHTDLICFLF